VQSFTVVLDAWALVPIATTHTLLRLAERDLLLPVLSERILSEAKRTVALAAP
jgi:hypothetical protein